MYEELMEEVTSDANAEVALKAVKRNKGKPGIDGMTTSELEGHLQKHWPTIRAKLLGGTYAVTPVREVEIPKPDGGSRKLGCWDRSGSPGLATEATDSGRDAVPMMQ
jgi:RNA-directed DNA polymerase